MSLLIETIKLIPILLRLGVELLKIIRETQDKVEKKQRLNELKSAVNKAKMEKDTSELERFFGRNVRARDIDSSK